MKINYFVEYINKNTNKLCRADLGYNADVVKAIALEHLQRGDINLVIIPSLEECSKDDPDNIEVIEAEAAERTEEC